MAVEHEPPPTPARRTTRSASSLLAHAVEGYALVAITLVAALVFYFLPATADTWPTAANFQAIAGSQAVLLVATLAVLVPLVCGEFDLSVGANLGLSTVVAGKVMSGGLPLVPTAIVGIACGTAVGLVNGLLVTRAKVNGVIVTLGVATIIEGLVGVLTNGVSISTGISTELIKFGSDNIIGIPQILIASLAVAVAVHYVLTQMPLGRTMYMFGANRNAARLVGIRNDRLLLLAFGIGGALAGAAGVLALARVGSASPTAGATYLLPAFAAAFLSAAAVRPGHFNVGGAVAAIAFLAVLNGGLNLAGASVYVADFVNGTALICGIGVAGALTRRRRSRALSA